MSIANLVESLKDVWDGSPWYGKSVKELLSKVDNDSPAILSILYHMISWRQFALNKLKGDDYSIELNSNQDWPKVNNLSLEECIKWLGMNLEAIITELSSKPDNWLENSVIGEKYNNRFLIEGIAQHDIYHIGQIILLHKMGL